MRHRTLRMCLCFSAALLCWWSTWGEARRSGCHGRHTCPPHNHEFSGQVVALTDVDTIQVRQTGEPTRFAWRELTPRRRGKPSGCRPYNSRLIWS